MILLDTDVAIDLLRGYPPATEWFASLNDDETLALSGFVMMELIQGCKRKIEQDRLKRALCDYEIIWLSSKHCNKALDVFIQYHLSHNAGLIDVLVGQTAVAFGVPLYTFNKKHYQFIPNLDTVQPYIKV
ncbi:MAG: type II toxin-antitoxin system VapC family toxin [Desulfamplus sp.]|nr:type II toxin-antitoxin system VapC family toxin [Desulfamplus sp.]